MKRVVIVGGGFTGTQCAMKLERDFDVTLVDTKDYFEFTPGILRVVAEPDHAAKLTVKHADYLKNTTIVVDTVTEVSKKEVKTKKQNIPFDYLIVTSGADADSPIKGKGIVTAYRIQDLVDSIETMKNAKEILVVGGGLVGVELAAEICTTYKDKNVTLVHSRDQLIDRNHVKAKQYADRFLQKHGVKILYGERGKKLDKTVFVTGKGTKVKCDVPYMCIGIKVNYEFMKKHFPKSLNERNSIIVDEFLHVQGQKHIFAGGNVTFIKEEKTAQTAERHAETIVANIRNAEAGTSLVQYQSKKRPMLISLGKHSGILDTGRFVMTGFIPAIMKTYVEWKTMKHYR